ncbi:hypothetical protein PMAC_002921 [Pneumocystis sp. 'macacae']|nr:hypothetical protein PMAC_002921 [Pneumocystis sp. 'macacae']
MQSLQIDEFCKNDKKDEDSQENNEERDILVRKRTVEDENETFIENLDEKRPKKDDGKNDNSNNDQISRDQAKLSNSPFASLKSRNITFPLNLSSQFAKRAFGSNISSSGFDSLVSPLKTTSEENVNISCESKTLNDSMKIHKKTPEDETFCMLLEKEVDSYTQKDDNEIKKSVIISEQEVKTGEEHEETIYSTRARLYVMDSDIKDWKERGIGMLRVNIEQTKGVITRSRLVMRTDAVYKVILNVPLFKEMMIEGGNSNTFGSMGLDKFLKIIVMENGKPTQFAIKVKDEIIAQQLRKYILSAMPNSKTTSYVTI